jgi:23S rRNA (guanosine2251-2'-O)-methyltransferase
MEGRNAVLEALRANEKLREIRFAVGLKHDPVLDEISRRAHAAGISLVEVPRRVLDELSDHGAHQGVIAIAPPFSYSDLESAIARVRDAERSLVVVLDHVTDPGNLGAVIRSAVAVGADAVIIPDRRAAGVTSVARKTAAGAVAHIPVVRVTNVARTLEQLKRDGYWVAGASEKADSAVWDAPLDARLALVMGAEGDGISRAALDACDLLVSIPMSGRVDSLNVAQAATVVMFEWYRRA